MTDLEKTEYAKGFIDKLANGINPLDDTSVPEGDLVNNIWISRCFFYVSSILQKEIDREKRKTPKEKKPRKAPFSITQAQLQNYVYSETPISVTAVAKKINFLVREEIEANNMEHLSYRQILQFLLNVGLLEYRELDNGRKKRLPTPEGESLGISLVDWQNYGRKAIILVYSAEAQQFILDHIDAIAAINPQKGKTSYPFGVEDQIEDEASDGSSEPF